LTDTLTAAVYALMADAVHTWKHRERSRNARLAQ